MADKQPLQLFTRRDLLKGAGAAAVTIAAPVGLVTDGDAATAIDTGAAQSVPPTTRAREAFETLNATEADILEAIVGRLIPSDELGPGAKEARAAHYIDRALAGALSSSRQAYASGLASLDAYARSSKGKSFVELTASDQDAVLTAVQMGTATGFNGSSTPFFNLVLNHTRQGTFGDPYYGGNANFVGWDILGYPGVRTMVTAADQQALEKGQLKPNHKSAYDFEAFNKATVSNHDFHGDTSHAD